MILLDLRGDPPRQSASGVGVWRTGGACLFVLVIGLLLPVPAVAIPVFARIYNKPCGACHTTFPQLNPEGEDFRAHGFHSLKPDIEPIRVGSGLEIPGTLPAAIYLSVGEDVISKDLPGPHSPTRTLFNLEFLKLVAAGELGHHMAFMLDYELVDTHVDTGEVVTDPLPYLAYLTGHLERWGWLGTLKAGWYELPLTVSPEVHRLSIRPYLAYGTNACALLGVAPPGTLCADEAILGDSQIGLDMSALQSESGFAWSAGITNGNNRRLDDTASPNGYLHLTQSFGLIRPGLLLFYSPDLIGHGVEDRTFRVGPDIDLYSRQFRLLGQFLAAHESNPTGYHESLWYYGGFLEASYRLTTTLASLLRVDVAWAPRFDDRGRGGDTQARREMWEFTGGMQWSMQENLKLVAEVTYADDHGPVSDPNQNTWTATLRVVTAFWPLTPPGLPSSLQAGRTQ